ncbi:hypothetical protein J2129_001265 [Methanofollis sp. W23]|uniref:hypothetical protein n=1 Tax=Methanofollis sp. W23 TaxID=2817849 RepID=UPI001AE705BD|nr:hypothetical protein [Methanofollis sp. W23]MBP2145811.1 hypothetical protein [Methanofollis sp. W23]
MPECFELTKCAKDILRYFIQVESSSIEYFCQRKIGGTQDTGKTALDPVYEYPSKIWKECGQKITKPTIKSWCEKFEDMGILSSEEKRTDGVNSFHKTKHYSLNHDAATLKQILEIIVKNFDPFERLTILSSAYFDYFIDENLVREILFKKSVYIRDSYDILDVNWENIRSAWNIWVQDEEFNEERLVEEVRSEISWTEDNTGRHSHRPDRCLISPCASNCAIPIVTDTFYKTRRSDFVDRIKFGFTIESADRAIRGYPEILHSHREVIEMEKCILPILTLIKSSPSALRYFLSGEWHSFELKKEMVEDHEYASEFMKDMVSIAARDISITLQIPMNNIVDYVDFNHREWVLSPDGDVKPHIAYMFFSLKNGNTLSIDLKYSARQISKQFCFIPVDGHGTCSPGTRYEVKIPDEMDFKLKIWTTDSPLCIAPEDIKDKEKFMEWLSSDSAIPRHLVQMLSNRVQNMIRVYPSKDNPSDTFFKLLLEDLNRALRRPDLFEKSCFEGTDVDIDGYCKIFERLNKDPVKHGEVQSTVTYYNRELIEAIIPDLLYKPGELQPSQEAVMEYIHRTFD